MDAQSLQNVSHGQFESAVRKVASRYQATADKSSGRPVDPGEPVGQLHAKAAAGAGGVMAILTVLMQNLPAGIALFKEILAEIQSGGAGSSA